MGVAKSPERAAERKAVWTRWEARGTEATRAQLEDLACLVADAPPSGQRALAALLETARDETANPLDLGAATLIAGRVFVWAGFVPEAEILRTEIHRLVTLSGSDLSETLFSRDWPRGSAPPQSLLWVRDRRLEAQGP